MISMPTDPSNPGARQSTISPIQSNNDNNGPPPPTRKRRTDLNKYRGISLQESKILLLVNKVYSY